MTNTLKDNIKKRLEQSGLSVTAFSTKAGLERTTVFKILKNANPTQNTLEKIAAAFGCSVQDLIGPVSNNSLKEDVSALIDVDLLGECITSADAIIRESPKKFTDKDRARLYLMVYEYRRLSDHQINQKLLKKIIENNKT